MRIIIAGTRTFSDYVLLKKTMDDIISTLAEQRITVISGGAKGADKLGEEWLSERLENSRSLVNWDLIRFPADWDKHGKAAGPIRNEEMANNADMCVVFWDGKSKGSAHMIKTALKKSLLVKVVNYGEDK